VNPDTLAARFKRLLVGVETNAVLKTLHFAARIVTHRKSVGSAVPWALGVPGEPEAAERQLAERLIHESETHYGKKVTEWSDDEAGPVIATLVTHALTLSPEQSTSDRMRAREFLASCRREAPGWDRESLGANWWLTFNSRREYARRSPARLKHSLFLSHGANELSYDKVRQFLERLAVDVVTFDETSARGRSVVEALEERASRSRFAVVLVAPHHATQSRTSAVPPANVFLELGYFLGRLGRQNVFVLVEPGVDVPSDLAGVLFHELDAENMWQRQLTAELRVAGFDVEFKAPSDAGA
jgi:hypothetical protein